MKVDKKKSKRIIIDTLRKEGVVLINQKTIGECNQLELAEAYCSLMDCDYNERVMLMRSLNLKSDINEHGNNVLPKYNYPHSKKQTTPRIIVELQ